MGKLNLTAQELQALYPPTSRAFENTVQNTLHNLAEGKGQPVMKKRISTALVVVLALIILTVSAAIALTQSDLIGLMFGSGVIVTKEVEEAIIKPAAVVSTADITVSLNEYLYDGVNLHLQWSVTNTSGRQVMVTMSRFQINGKYTHVEKQSLFQSDDHALAHVLGGGADDAPMPVSINNFATYSNDQNENDPILNGKTVEVSCDIYIWELSNPPVLISNSRKVSEEEYAKVRGLHRLPVDKNGLCILDQFIWDDGSVDAETGEDYRRAYERLGWAKLTKVQPVLFDVELESKPIRQVQPAQTTYETDNFAFLITRMVFMQTGGTLELLVYPKDNSKAVGSDSPFLDLVVLNADTKEPLHGSRTSSTQDNFHVSYNIALRPVAGDMPKAILIVPRKESAGYFAQKKGQDEYIMEDAVRVDLE